MDFKPQSLMNLSPYGVFSILAGSVTYLVIEGRITIDQGLWTYAILGILTVAYAMGTERRNETTALIREVREVLQANIAVMQQVADLLKANDRQERLVTRLEEIASDLEDHQAGRGRKR